MPKPSRFNDRFAHLQQHYEATEPRWLKVEREKDKATAQVMAALNPQPPLSVWDEMLLQALMGKTTVFTNGVPIHDLVYDTKLTIDRVTGVRFDPIKSFIDDIEATNGYSRSPTGRIRR